MLLRLFIMVIFLLSGCAPDYEGMAEKRLAQARQNHGDIHITALQDLNKSAFLEGVLLAAEEINQRPNKLLGRNLQIHIEQDGPDFQSTKSTIRRIANNPKMVAVLGHRSSEVAIPASVIYERSHLIFMTPFATSEKLTNYYFQYVYRMIPGNTTMMEQIASMARTLEYRKIVILYTRDDFSREQAFMAEDAALSENIEVINRKSFFSRSQNYRPVIAEFNNSTFDAIFIAAPPVPAGRMVRQLREMGVDQPILGSDQLNSANYLKIAGGSAENTILPDVFPVKGSNPRRKKFIESYSLKYSVLPDYNAAQGYDSLMLLATAIENAGSTLPSLLSSNLHFMPAWVGITGIHAFTKAGDMLGKKYYFKVWQNGTWHSMPAIDIPYTLERFQAQLPSSATNFSKEFAKKMHDDDHKTLSLDLAHEILRFKRIGIIYENTKNGRTIASYDLLQEVAKKKKIEVVECRVPLSILEPEEAIREIISCYGKLSLNVDVLFTHPFHGLDAKIISKLNESLAFFKIPAIALENRNNDQNLSIILEKRSDISLRGMGEMQVYRDLLENLKVHEFATRLKNLPEISVNLQNLQAQGLPDNPILLLSPDHYYVKDSQL